MEAETNSERTILDYLREDIWHAVLDYVPLRDIIVSERVSRRWQKAMFEYLQTVRFSITFEEEGENNSHSDTYCLKLMKNKYASFILWTKKLGLSVVASYCCDKESLQTIRMNCPHLEALTLLHMHLYKKPTSEVNQNPVDLQNLNQGLKCLRKLCFYGFPVPDHCVSQFIADKALEEIEFYDCVEVTGQCFNTIKLSNIKSLVFSSCNSLEPHHVVSITNQLGVLTKLELFDVPVEITREIQLTLDRMPKLEKLKMFSNPNRKDQAYLLSSEPLCQLSRLTYLSTDLKVTDDVVETVTQSCKELQNLDFADCEVLTSLAVEAICRNAGARLTELGMYNFCYLTDDDVVACVRGCPELTLLSVGGTALLTPALPERAAAARHTLRPGCCLRLDAIDTNLTDPYYLESVEGEYEDMREVYEDLILELN